MEKLGEKIAGSRFYRAFCARCSDPLRVDEEVLKKGIDLYCEQCSPTHMGCTSPPSPNTDVDEYSSSWAIASGIKG